MAAAPAKKIAPVMSNVGQLFADNAVTQVKSTKARATAYVNWEIPREGNEPIKSGKGFPIFQNPLYPNSKEDLLVSLAQSQEGEVTLMMKVTIRLAKLEEEGIDNFAGIVLL